MAERKDGTPKRGSGPSLPRKHSVADLVGKANRSPDLIEDELWPIVFRRGFNENRAWHRKGLQELILATGWKRIHPETVSARGRIPDLEPDYFFVEFPLSYSRSRDRHSLQSCRIYPGRIEMPKCRKAHRCAIVDVASENPFRLTVEGAVRGRSKPYQRKRARDKRSGSIVELELLIEKPCECFNESDRDHEGSIFIYHRG